MSYSLEVADGDLVQRGSQLGLVFGVDKLKQDINMWLMERHGGDRFHRDVGSVLDEFIGDVVSESTKYEVHAEIIRVLQNYQILQAQRQREHPELLSFSELLVQVDDIIVGVDYDTVNVSIKIRNGSDEAHVIKVVQTTVQ